MRSGSKRRLSRAGKRSSNTHKVVYVLLLGSMAFGVALRASCVKKLIHVRTGLLVKLMNTWVL